MSEKAQNVQDVFLNHLRKNKTPVTIFLVNGVKLQGIVTWFDNFSVLLRRDGHSQLVYKHAISTIMPVTPVQRRARTAQAAILPPAEDAGTLHALVVRWVESQHLTLREINVLVGGKGVLSRCKQTQKAWPPHRTA